MNNKQKILRFVEDLRIIRSNDFSKKLSSNAALILERNRINAASIEHVLMMMLHEECSFTNACLQEYVSSTHHADDMSAWVSFFSIINISKKSLMLIIQKTESKLPALILPSGINQIF
jgi:hypothetical protein